MTDQIDMNADIVTGNVTECLYCHEQIGEVIDPYSGVVDWGTFDFTSDTRPTDFGCGANPINSDEGTGSHHPSTMFHQPGAQAIVTMELARRLTTELERLATSRTIETRETGQPTITIFDRIGSVLTNWRVVIDPTTSVVVRARIIAQDVW